VKVAHCLAVEYNHSTDTLNTMLPISFKKRELGILSARNAYDALDGNFSTQENPKQPRRSDPKAAKCAAAQPALWFVSDKLGSEDPTPPHVPRTT
jgi:hypothetical protein